MNMFARFDENLAMTLQVIKKTKRYGRKDGRTHGRTDKTLRTDARTDARTDGRTVILSKIIFSEPNSFMHMFNVSTLYRQSIKLFHQKLWQELISPCMAYNSISIKPYIKSHLELQRELTLIELAPSPYFFV